MTVELLLIWVDDWRGFIAGSSSVDDGGLFLRHERTGRPLGDEGFVQHVSKLIGRDLMPKKPGRKRKEIGIVSPDFCVCPLIFVSPDFLIFS